MTSSAESTRGRVLIIHHSAQLGGGTVSLLDVVQMLGEKFEVTVVTPTPGAQLAARLESLGCRHIAVDRPYPLINHYNGGPTAASKTFWSGLARAVWPWRGWRQLITSGFDLVVLNTSVLAPLAYLARSERVPVIALVRETLPPRSPRTRLLRWVLNWHCDAVGFLSDYDLNEAQLRRPKTAVIRDVLRPQEWRRIARRDAVAELGLAEQCVNILFLGGSSPLKALDVVLAAHQILDRDDVQLMVAGGLAELAKPVGLARLRAGAQLYRRRLSAAVAASRQRNVAFVGPLADPSVAYSAADIVVFAATKPHQARPIFEAGWFGLPVVAPDFENLRELLVDGVNGLSYPHRDPTELAARLRQLADDPGLRLKLGEANRERSAAMRDPAAAGTKLLALADHAMTCKVQPGFDRQD